MPSVFIVNGGGAYAAMFKRMGWTLSAALIEADLVQFTGGEDVDPALYGEHPHPSTMYNSMRDEFEKGTYEFCVEHGKKMAGICRGAQFLNVMNGGKLYQDVGGHAIAGTHHAYSLLRHESVRVTSTHHQMMIPSPDGILEAWATAVGTNKTRMEGAHRTVVDKGDVVDPEVVFYPESNSLCFQPHPEHYGQVETRDYYFELLSHYLELSE